LVSLESFNSDVLFFIIILVTEKTGLYFIHISALTIACRRLWIGTGNGIIISVPLTDSKY
jgi:hypothetical protein